MWLCVPTASVSCSIPKTGVTYIPSSTAPTAGRADTIIKDLPYDRPATTMADFPMCDACRAEYEDPTNRRFHAQPVACPDCGPFVQLRAPSELFSKVVNIDMRWSAIVKARRLLREGKIIAIKGLGGFHLACDAVERECCCRAAQAQRPGRQTIRSDVRRCEDRRQVLFCRPGRDDGAERS